MLLNNNTSNNYTTRQLKLPLEIQKLIDISDPVYTFCEVVDHIDLSRYFVEKGYKKGRPRCDEQRLLKVILFAFITLLGYDIYLRKQVIEKMIDELYQPESNNKAEKKKKK